MFFLQKYYLNGTGKQDVMLATVDVKRALADSKVKNGLVNVALTTGSAALMLLENDPKITQQLKDHLIAAFAPDAKKTEVVNRRSGSGPAYEHLRAALLNPTLNLPIKDGQLAISPWQEIMVFEFEEKPHRREIIVTVLGE